MKRNFGFTIIELMIVVAIVAILVALAVPAFTEWIRKANRAEAQGLLLNWANNQEIWRAGHTSYGVVGDVPAPTHPRFTFDDPAPAAGCPGTEEIAQVSVNCYRLVARATDVGGQDQDKERGTDCDVLSVDQAGLKFPSICWQE